MPWFGAHMSIAGGWHRAPEAARQYGMDTVQLFTASPQNWQVKRDADQWLSTPMAKADIALFRWAVRAAKLRFPMAHDSYLVNLASPDELLYRKSIEAFVVELQRAEALGLRYLVTHPGAALAAPETEGLTRVAAALDEVHERCAGFKVQVLLETTAGQGSSLGHRFEHLAAILAQVKDASRLGVCLDTCHVFAAGYALSPEPEYRKTMRAFDRTVGLSRLKAFHVNDSKKGFGSRVDRHAHIGAGELGLEPFRLLVNDPRFRTKPMILETPKEDENGNAVMDAMNLATLRGLVETY